MRLSTRLSVILTCIVATAAIPLNLEVEERKNIVTPPLTPQLQQARDDVNIQIPKMLQSLDDAATGIPAAIDRVKLAFGPEGVDQIPTIKENVKKIEAGTMVVSQKKPGEVKKDRGQINAITPFEDYRNTENDPLITYPVEFGNMFYRPPQNEANRKARASTVLHEAAHVFALASDDHYTTGKKNMVPFGLKLTDNQARKVKTQGGYAAEDPVVGSATDPITEDKLDATFKEVRDSATNMHMNADSYALFGAVCDEQMTRRRKRALMEDDPIAYYLAKRGAAFCELPPDYFKNRAAAKVAKEKAASTSSPASKAEVAKTANKNVAGVGSGGRRTVKGGKPLATHKSTLKTPGKATKSTRPKTSKSGLSKGSLKAKISTSKTSKALYRGKISKFKPSKPSSKAAKDALKGSTSKSLKAKNSNAKTKTKTKTSKSKMSKPLFKSSKSTRDKSVKANASKASSKKAVKSKASRLGSSRTMPEKGTKAKVLSDNRSSLKKGAAGAAKKAGVRGVKQTKMSSTRSPASREQRISKQSSKLSGPRASTAKSSKATSATRKAEAAPPKAVRTKASIPSQKVTKASTAPKVAKALSKSVVGPLNAAALPKKNGKP